MKKTAVAVALVLGLFAQEVWAAKTTYIVTNNRFNYVKLRELGAKEADVLKMTHPATLDEKGLRAALASVQLARAYIVKKEVDSQQVFDERAIDYLTPALVRAFSQAKENEIVVFSYVTKDPLFIIRNDRLNICRAWVSGDELHIRFEKLYAKLLGDTDKRGNESKLISQARGLRVKLELGEGQKLGIDDPEELVLGLNYNYVKKPEPKPVPTEGVTMTGESVPFSEGAADAGAKAPGSMAKEKKGRGKPTKEGALAAETTPSAAPTPKSAKDRLEELNQLKKDGLIDKKEFDEKKKEILKEL